MKRNTPKVGDKLFSLNIGNAARNREQKLTPVIVTKVGRKYFTARESGREWSYSQYHIDTWREKTEYCCNSVLYETEQEWLDEKESDEICRYIFDSFQYGKNQKKLSIGALRTIQRIIGANITGEE